MMLEKLKDKLPKTGKAAKPAGIEIEIGEEESEEEMPEGEGEEEEIAVGELAKFSDEELKAELEKRGMMVATGGSGTTALPELEETDEMPVPPKKKG